MHIGPVIVSDVMIYPFFTDQLQKQTLPALLIAAAASAPAAASAAAAAASAAAAAASWPFASG